MQALQASPSVSVPERAADGGAPAVTFWEHASFSAAHAAVSFLYAVLGLAGLYRFGRLFGTIEWLINYKRRRRFAAALESVWGRRPTAAERRKHTRKYFCQSRCDRLLYLTVDRIARSRAADLLIITNRETLDAAVAAGRGVYIALAHHGAQHVIGMLLTLNGYKVAGVRDRREGALRRFVQCRLDRSFPELGRTRVLYSDSFPRDIYRSFQEGYVLGSALDIGRIRDARQRVEEVSLFGERRYCLSGPLRIALRCGAPVLQAFIIPEPKFRFRFEIVETLIAPEAVEDENTVIRRAIERYAANVERYTRARPSLISRV
jgi:lauroyl/myristoyl acyltransferase